MVPQQAGGGAADGPHAAAWAEYYAAIAQRWPESSLKASQTQAEARAEQVDEAAVQAAEEQTEAGQARAAASQQVEDAAMAALQQQRASADAAREAVGATLASELQATEQQASAEARQMRRLKEEAEERARSAEAEMQALRQQAEMATELRERAEKAEQEQKAMEKQKAKVEEELREHTSEEAFWQRYLAFKHYLDTLREHAGKTAKNKWPLKIRREHLVADVLEKFGKLRARGEMWRETEVTFLRDLGGFEVEEEGADDVRARLKPAPCQR